ncbi:beta-lactamase class A [Spinactinospora alkalitolerans]|uniref:Beta-lactamase class A n=1 Tax=Spinactinospora alkalitolerans TaxID=687207 RepID=A0A852TZA8_9ACTN|nr:serine hydrolase [Spinactinospora alkalitolerans]NYE49258.1 beta-lactamase class A [Spinactinospora alkalitolerans]
MRQRWTESLRSLPERIAPPSRRARHWLLTGSVVAVALVLLLAAVGVQRGPARTATAAGAPGSAGPSPGPSPRPSPEPEPQRGSALAPGRYERLTGAVEDHLGAQEGRLAIALHDLGGGATYSYASDERFRTASLVKLNILVLLLLRADDADRALTGEERDLAERMIRYSDNDVTDVLYERIGFTPGFVEGNERLGLHATEPGAGGAWGATTTTAADQLRLLRAVFTDAGPLSRRSRAYARDLLGSVAPEQAWGVSTAAGDRDLVELKNGWAPQEADAGRWAINSAGRVRGPERDYLIAVLSDRHGDYAGGIECVEHVVTEVAAAIEEDRS